MVGRNEDNELSVIRDTVRMIITMTLEAVEKCKTVDEVIELLNRWLMEN